MAGCAPPSDAARYAEALAAADIDGAWAACAPIAAARVRADCQHEAIARFAAFSRCPELPEGVWREECAFSQAEHLARQAAWADAIAACRTSRFVRNCETHVLDAFAMTQHAAPVPEAAAALAPLVPGLDIAHVAHEFWYAYFRIRIDAGLPVDAEPCPDDLCDGGARRAVMRVVEQDRKKAPDGPAPTYAWATSEWATRAVALAWERPPERPRDAGRRRPPEPPRGGGEGAPPPPGAQPGPDAAGAVEPGARTR